MLDAKKKILAIAPRDKDVSQGTQSATDIRAGMWLRPVWLYSRLCAVPVKQATDFRQAEAGCALPGR